jgi:hypothetical protein
VFRGQILLSDFGLWTLDFGRKSEPFTPKMELLTPKSEPFTPKMELLTPKSEPFTPKMEL